MVISKDGMTFNYYSFILNGQEKIYYTYVVHDTTEEILEWAERFGFIQENDIPNCTNVRVLSMKEVEERNKKLYNLWWNKHHNDAHISGMVPPTIGEVQLN